MSRRSTSFLEDLMNIAEALPWWAGVILAVSSYFVIHQFTYFNSTILNVFAIFLQIVIPLAFLLGALLSAIHQLKRGNLFDRQSSLDSIRKLGWKEFEQLISEAFRRQGYLVFKTDDGPDGGVDLILNKGNRKTFVQCKHWKKYKVGVKEVRELNGVISAKVAHNGILVTSGVFTTDAIDFAKSCPIELIDGNKLTKLIPQIKNNNRIEINNEQNPSCPKCGSEMVKRTAKKGPNAGNQFWGCSEFPDCHGSLNIN